MKTYLGIDIGSLSTNLVLLDEQKEILIKKYLPTAGKPIEAVKQGLKEIRQEIKDEVEVLGVGTTGSGRYMIADLVGADIIKNEITAQANGAVNAEPEVDTVFEIGGQDSKYISLENGVVVDFTMNKVCAAGTGSFLEEQAEKLGINIKEEFSQLALKSKSPSLLGDRCTVFIESELNKYLQKGASKENLTAGLARAIVKNYLNKVVETRRVGNKILFQGGVAFNKSVVKAFEAITDKKIIIPPHHEVTGAIGIALIAMKERAWDKSKFKGFNLSQMKYKIESFECKSCENLCEINKILAENESPIYYGGRCEKWEKERRNEKMEGLRDREVLPDLFKERDEIIFGQAQNKGGKRIGLPRVLFFFERFPFWQAFFNELGFEVVLSSPSNQKIIRNSFENTPVEACFPIMLAHGHILDLLDKKIDCLFIPSLINMEKASEKFNESFNCPFIQALPYFAKAGIKFDKHLKILSPNLEPQRGKNYFNKQLQKLGKSLGQRKETIIQAIEKAEKAQNQAKEQLIKRGQEVLKQIETEKIPALAIISRPYNGSDPILNLNIPKKLKDMGVLAIPMDYLPASRASIAHEYPNMYWNYGQKMLAAAKLVNNHPTLSAIHISNFRCGPDSFISHQLKEIINSKPFLQIEVDEHASDTGVITRLEAFLDSLKNKTTKACPELVEGLKETPRRQTSKKQRTLFISRMSDHALALSAAIRACGVDSQTLPPSDERTLELGRKHTSGKECHPFIVTTGDFIKKIQEPGLDRDRTAFFMPSASGPCRFGHYNHTHRIIFDRLGYHDIPLVSPDAKDSYSKSMGLDLRFRRYAWQGIVAVDLLTKLTFETRPYEKNRGETDEIQKYYLNRICQAVEAGKNKIFKLMTDMREGFAAIPQSRNGKRPVIGIIGEIYLRCNPECNADVARKIEQLGGEAWVAPISEWFYYTNAGYIYESFMRRMPHHVFLGLARDLAQKWDEHRLSKPFEGQIKNLHEPSTLKVLKLAAPYLHYSYKGEAILSVGKALDFIEKGASGIVNILPFTCMPGTIVSALGKQIREKNNNLPWLDISIDGNEGVNLETRLEAFMHQTRTFSSAQ